MDGLSNCLPRNEKEKQVAVKLGFPRNIRLACQTKISGDITIKRPVVDKLDIEIILKQFEDESGTKLGKEKDLAILFTNIENYTQFAEGFPAYDVVHVLNRYYQTMNEIIVQHKGIISDVAGDGILALFGAMEDSKNPVLDATSYGKSPYQAIKSSGVEVQKAAIVGPMTSSETLNLRAMDMAPSTIKSTPLIKRTDPAMRSI